MYTWMHSFCLAQRYNCGKRLMICFVCFNSGERLPSKRADWKQLNTNVWEKHTDYGNVHRQLIWYVHNCIWNFTAHMYMTGVFKLHCIGHVSNSFGLTCTLAIYRNISIQEPCFAQQSSCRRRVTFQMQSNWIEFTPWLKTDPVCYWHAL